MREFFGIVRYEYLMQIRRAGLWVSLLITLGLFFWLFSRVATVRGLVPPADTSQPWRLATIFIEEFNLFGPIVAGILASDRLARDRVLGMSQLLASSLRSHLPLVLGKSLGSLLAIFTPPTGLLVILLAFLAHQYDQPALFLTGPIVILAVVLPSWLFVIAWSLLFPLVMPLRLYQVLFAGFWMWAVAVSPSRLPTINWSIFGVSGQYAHYALFLRDPAQSQFLRPPGTVGWAIVNMGLILGLSLAALALTYVLLGRMEQAS